MPDKVSTATPQENAEAFARARKIVEKITPFLQGVNPFDEAMALQLLIARSGLKMNRKPEEVLAVMAHNMPMLYQMWQAAFLQVTERGNAQIFEKTNAKPFKTASGADTTPGSGSGSGSGSGKTPGPGGDGKGA